MKRLLLLLVCLQAPAALALNTATSVPISTSAGVNLAVGWPNLGVGVRLPVFYKQLSLLVGASVKPTLLAPELNVGLGYVLPIAGPLQWDVAGTAGVSSPLMLGARVAPHLEGVTRGILQWKHLRLWAGPEVLLNAEVDLKPRVELGLGTLGGAQWRLGWVELGAVLGVGGRAAWVREITTPAPQVIRPEVQGLFTISFVLPDGQAPLVTQWSKPI